MPMILERAEIIIQDGRMDEFIAMFTAQALPLTAQFEGIISFKGYRGEEERNNFMFLAEWESLEVHLKSRDAPEHEAFRQLVFPFVAGAKPTVHFYPV